MANIKTIKLGAPSIIDGSAAQNVELSLQLASRLNSVSLRDGEDGTYCTTDGAIVTAVKLIRQFMYEKSSNSTTWEGHSLSFAGSDADAARFIGHGGSIALSLMNGNIPVHANDVWWEVNVTSSTEGASVSVSQDGIITASTDRNIRGIVKAISKTDYTKQVCIYFIVVPTISSIVAQYTNLVSVLTKNPSLADVIIEWPSVVNSLVNTGKRNWLVGDGVAYINTGIVPKLSEEVGLVAKVVDYGAWFFGTRVNGAGGVYTYAFVATNNTTIRAYKGNIGSIDILQSVPSYNTIIYHSHERKYVFNDREYDYASDITIDMQYPIVVFGLNDNGNVIAPSKGNIQDVLIGEHHLVAFVRNGVNGMLDLYDNKFYENTSTSGTLKIIENETID